MIWKSDMFTFSFLYNWQLDKIQESNKKIEEKRKKNLKKEISTRRALWEESNSYNTASSQRSLPQTEKATNGILFQA